MIADRYRGKRLNSPNDATVRSDGSIWFSDPDFPDNLTKKFKEFWGYIHEEKIGPVMLGEFGLRDRNTRNPVYREWTDAAVSSLAKHCPSLALLDLSRCKVRRTS